MGEHKQGPALNKMIMLFKGGVLHFHQSYVRPTSFLKETLHVLCAVPNRANKGGYHGYTFKKIRIWNVLFFNFVGVHEWFQCSAELKIRRKLPSLHRAQSHSLKFFGVFFRWDRFGPMTIWGRGYEGSGESLLRDLDRENSLGSEREERIGEKGILWWENCWSGDCWGGDCWGCFGGDWLYDRCCDGACTGGCCDVVWGVTGYEFLFLFLLWGRAAFRMFCLRFHTVLVPFEIRGCFHFPRLFSLCVLFSLFSWLFAGW